MPRLYYTDYLQPYARKLRSNLTDVELLLWSNLRRKQILGVQFYRQKAVGNFIVDFFAPTTKLVIELDGSQHVEETHCYKDKMRDFYLRKLGLLTLRFHNTQIIDSLESVLEQIYDTVAKRLAVHKNPP